MRNFAKSVLGNVAGNVGSALKVRPSDLLEYPGSAVERLLIDSEILAEVSTKKEPKEPETTQEKIMEKRKLKGYPT